MSDVMVLELTMDERIALLQAIHVGLANVDSDERTLVRAVLKRMREGADNDDSANDGAG